MDMKLRNEYIKALRKQKLWSQDELAMASNLSLRTIQRIEKNGEASMETLRSIASAFEVRAEELIALEKFTQYHHTQIGWTVLIIMSLVILLLLYLAKSPILCLIPVIVSCLIGSLTIKVKEDLIQWRFGLGLIRKREQISEIAQCEVVKNKWWFGYGIRYSTTGFWLYNVSGLDAVEITLKSGRKFRLGTDEPNYLCKAIKAAINNSI